MKWICRCKWRVEFYNDKTEEIESLHFKEFVESIKQKKLCIFGSVVNPFKIHTNRCKRECRNEMGVFKTYKS